MVEVVVSRVTSLACLCLLFGPFMSVLAFDEADMLHIVQRLKTIAAKEMKSYKYKEDPVSQRLCEDLLTAAEQNPQPNCVKTATFTGFLLKANLEKMNLIDSAIEKILEIKEDVELICALKDVYLASIAVSSRKVLSESCTEKCAMIALIVRRGTIEDFRLAGLAKVKALTGISLEDFCSSTQELANEEALYLASAGREKVDTYKVNQNLVQIGANTVVEVKGKLVETYVKCIPLPYQSGTPSIKHISKLSIPEYHLITIIDFWPIAIGVGCVSHAHEKKWCFVITILGIEENDNEQAPLIGAQKTKEYLKNYGFHPNAFAHIEERQSILAEKRAVQLVMRAAESRRGLPSMEIIQETNKTAIIFPLVNASNEEEELSSIQNLLKTHEVLIYKNLVAVLGVGSAVGRARHNNNRYFALVFKTGTKSEWLKKLKNIKIPIPKSNHWAQDIADYKVQVVVQEGGNFGRNDVVELPGFTVVILEVVQNDRNFENDIKTDLESLRKRFLGNGIAAWGVREFTPFSPNTFTPTQPPTVNPDGRGMSSSGNVHTQVVLVLTNGNDIVSTLEANLKLPVYAKFDPQAMFDAYKISCKDKVYKVGYHEADGYGLYVQTKQDKKEINVVEWFNEVKKEILKQIKQEPTKLGFYVKRAKPSNTLFVVFRGRGYGEEMAC